MPTYAYRREDGTEFEFIQGMNDPHLEVCPETGQSVKRIYNYTPQVMWWNGSFVRKQEDEKKIIQSKKDPLYTTIPHYKEKAKEMREKAKVKENPDRIIVGG